MKQEPLISIVTPVYNASDFIEKTVDSVLSQTFTDFEYILVNDQSTDNSLSILEDYAEVDDRIKVITLEENSGAAVARNTGLEAARGRYIAFIDSDDVWHREKLANQINFMQDNDYEFTYTDFALISEDGAVLKERTGIPANIDYDGLLKNTTIACSTVMIDRTNIGDFRMPLVRKGQDTATWLMLMREHNLTAYGLQEVLNYYRQVAGSISSNKVDALKRTWNTYYRLEKLPLPKAIYYFVHYVWNAVRRRL
ncbi:glycosyltransferase family 2 protein [Aerococcaceae bacterium DSM 111176]|nr:glycosyltransferase family 2 protein [Aerococcaceae bacterium DSM 111176]